MAMGGVGFDDFVDGELPRLLRFGHLLTGNRHDAWDLTQDTLARVGLAWLRVRQEGNPSGYAHRTLVRLHISRWRKLRRELLVRDSPDRLASDDVDAVELAPPLAAALAELGTSQRTAVVLRYYRDLTIAEVAAEMGCSEGNAKSQISRGLRRLEQVLGTDPRSPESDRTELTTRGARDARA